ncbi:MAG TPA: sigma-54-dependent Fis family transcriptional regulator [Lacipirellulaceae bacterium]|nr:sigma-54-dependent Fis family transcriptional regulator [Lacipirellulaceae bacterium]
MRPAQNLQLAVWQSISRHLDVSESTNLTAALLAQHVPVSTLIIYRVDTEHRRVRVIANGPESPAAEPFNELEFQESAWRRLDRWMRQQTLLHRVDDLAKEDSIFGLLYPSSPAGDWLIAPLHGEHGARGILLALAKPKTKFTELDIELLESILEPMGVALDNDARLHELAALREAAEAERQSLLRRMGRNDTGETIVGEDAGLAPVMQRVDLVSRSEVPVLILGETGTGKELVARAIHNRNERHSGPFMRVNCGAIPRELIDSQLFGHEKGSFTGASETRQGWFERADMGTLFLDEIGELPLDAQVRFLRVLQDGYVERVGGSKPIRVNVRVVAATHRDLAAMVREGTFREDLWYRIAVFPILLPPLRDRVGDIPSLARHFAQRAAIRFGLAPVLPSDADIELLQSYDWPGNIRELGAVIDRAAILGDGRSLELAAALGVSGGSPRRVEQSTAIIQPNGDAVRQQRVATLNDAMRAHIELALRLARGRIEGPRGAAKQLAINPHTLRARMRKLKIDWSAYRDAASDDLD